MQGASKCTTLHCVGLSKEILQFGNYARTIKNMTYMGFLKTINTMLEFQCKA